MFCSCFIRIIKAQKTLHTNFAVYSSRACRYDEGISREPCKVVFGWKGKFISELESSRRHVIQQENYRNTTTLRGASSPYGVVINNTAFNDWTSHFSSSTRWLRPEIDRSSPNATFLRNPTGIYRQENERISTKKGCFPWRIARWHGRPEHRRFYALIKHHACPWVTGFRKPMFKYFYSEFSIVASECRSGTELDYDPNGEVDC